MKRGWCPDVLRPMPTGDGLLVRLHPPLGGLTAGQLQAVATTARSCGNGLLDVSSRGNLQIRGICERSHSRAGRAAFCRWPGRLRTAPHDRLAARRPRPDRPCRCGCARATGRSRAAGRRGASRQARNRGRRRRAVPAGRAGCRDLRGRRLQQQHRRRSRRWRMGRAGAERRRCRRCRRRLSRCYPTLPTRSGAGSRWRCGTPRPICARDLPMLRGSRRLPCRRSAQWRRVPALCKCRAAGQASFSRCRLAGATLTS